MAKGSEPLAVFHFSFDFIYFAFFDTPLMTCSLDAKMVANFAKKREVGRRARETALRASAVNPMRTVESSLLAIAAALGDTTPTPVPRASTKRSPQATRVPSSGKGKEPLVSQQKRAREGAEVEPPRKRIPQVP